MNVATRCVAAATVGNTENVAALSLRHCGNYYVSCDASRNMLVNAINFVSFAPQNFQRSDTKSDRNRHSNKMSVKEREREGASGQGETDGAHQQRP